MCSRGGIIGFKSEDGNECLSRKLWNWLVYGSEIIKCDCKLILIRYYREIEEGIWINVEWVYFVYAFEWFKLPTRRFNNEYKWT